MVRGKGKTGWGDGTPCALPIRPRRSDRLRPSHSQGENEYGFLDLIVDPLDNSFVFRYDSFDRPRLKAFAGGGVETLEYDLDGRLVRHGVYTNAITSRTCDINDPNLGAWWGAGDHLSNARAYNQAWEEFLGTNPTRDETLEFGRNLARQYGLG